MTQAVISRTAVYRFFDLSGQLLYVGITGSPVARFDQHRKAAPWWSYVDHDRTTIDWHANRVDAAVTEADAIRDERPAFNVVGVRSFGGRPATTLDGGQRTLLEVATRAARGAREADRKAWDDALAARRAGVPDELLCDQTGLSRATLNRRFGPRREVADGDG